MTISVSSTLNTTWPFAFFSVLLEMADVDDVRHGEGVWKVDPVGGVGDALLHLEWADGALHEFDAFPLALDELEGYADGDARDESRAWVALLEGNVHAALVRPSHIASPAVVDITLD